MCQRRVILINITWPRPIQNGCHFQEDNLDRTLYNENLLIFIQISSNFVPKDQINNDPALVDILAWWLSGDKPLSEPMVAHSTNAYMCHSALITVTKLHNAVFN